MNQRLHTRFVTALVVVAFVAAAVAQSAPTPGQVAPQALQQQANTQNPFLGGVPQGKATAEAIPLTLQDAIQRALRNNLGPVVANLGSRTAAGQKWRALSDLLPNLRTMTGVSVQRINTKVFGIPLPPGTPEVVGPFSVVDSRARMTENLLDLHAINNYRANVENEKAANLTYKDARDLVVLVAAGLYFQVVANEARVEAAQARLQTAEALYKQTSDMKNAGVVAGIDVLRADVERKSEQQRLTALQNDLDKSRLQLARAIGLPLGQKFTIAEKVPFQPFPALPEEAALKQAYASRSDYQALQALVRSAERSKAGAQAERLPALRVNGDYGLIGRNPGDARGTYTLAAGIDFPIFQGGKVHGDILQADAALQTRRAQLEDMRSRIDYEVRSALLDLNSAAQQVEVAQAALDVANQELTQARDRFVAGVADNLEVVRAQESVATANENFIASVYAHNFAKASLARALGIADEAAQQFFGGKP